jgi:hypothetical protein
LNKIDGNVPSNRQKHPGDGCNHPHRCGFERLGMSRKLRLVLSWWGMMCMRSVDVEATSRERIPSSCQAGVL